MDLKNIVAEIGELDKRILTLLNQRAQRVMAARRLPPPAAAWPPQFDQSWLQLNCGPLPESSLKYLFGEIAAACNNISNPLQVGFVGPKGSFCQQAALRYMGSSCQFVELPSVVDVFTEVSRSHCQVGVVPVENSSETETGVTLDQFFNFDLQICGEIYAPNNLTIFSRAAELEQITDIYCHPLTLSQCRGWLNRNLPYAAIHERAGVAAAADSAADKTYAAALGSELAAKLFNLNILASDLSDQPQSRTRFLALGRHTPPASGQDKTSIMFAMNHEPGFLYQSLSYFKDLNLSRVESRPTLGKPWNYSMFIDLPGHASDPRVEQALQGLRKFVGEIKILGSYPQG
jgi:chorismate mutase/prephenate dehydratase